MGSQSEYQSEHLKFFLDREAAYLPGTTVEEPVSTVTWDEIKSAAKPWVEHLPEKTRRQFLESHTDHSPLEHYLKGTGGGNGRPVDDKLWKQLVERDSLAATLDAISRYSSGDDSGYGSIEAHTRANLRISQTNRVEGSTTQPDGRDRFQHPSSTEQSTLLRCNYDGCSHKSNSTNDLRHHRRCHIPMESRPHPCPHCHQRFLHPKDVKRHLSTHGVGRRYYCDVDTCAYAKKGFGRKENLFRHTEHKHAKDTALNNTASSEATSQTDGPAFIHETVYSDGAFGKTTPRSSESSQSTAYPITPCNEDVDTFEETTCTCPPKQCHAKECPPEDPPRDPAIARLVSRVLGLINVAKGEADRANSSGATGAGPGATGKSRSGTHPTERPAKGSKRRKIQGDDEEDGGQGTPGMDGGFSKGDQAVRLYACPIAKHNSHACKSWSKGYLRFCDLKQHLGRPGHLDKYRRFRPEVGCNRTFAELEEALKPASGKDGATKWRIIYRFLYPDTIDIPNPFLDASIPPNLVEQVSQLQATNASLLNELIMYRQFYGPIPTPAAAPISTPPVISTGSPSMPLVPSGDMYPFQDGMPQHGQLVGANVQVPNRHHTEHFTAPIWSWGQGHNTQTYPPQLAELQGSMNLPDASSTTLSYSHETPPVYIPETSAQNTSLPLYGIGSSSQSHDLRGLSGSNIVGHPAVSDSGYSTGNPSARMASQRYPPSARSASVLEQPGPNGMLDDDLYDQGNQGHLDPNILGDLSQSRYLTGDYWY